VATDEVREASRARAPDSPSPGEYSSSSPPGAWAKPSSTTDLAAIQEQLAKAIALVDHYYAAYREARALLDRRDRQLAELRRKLDSAPVVVRHR